MKNVLLAAVLSGAIGGVAAGVATKMATSPDSTQTVAGQNTALTPTSAKGDTDLATRFAALKRENDEMALRLAALESRGTSRREEIADDGRDLGELEKQIADLAAALKNPTSAQSAGLRDMVAIALDEVQEIESKERQLEREQRDIERIQERMDEYAQKLGLDALQRTGMQAALIDESTRRNELFTAMRDGTMERDEMRTAFNLIREDTQGTLGNLLTPMQLEDYNEMAGDRGGRFGGRGGGGNTGGGGGRGGRGN